MISINWCRTRIRTIEVVSRVILSLDNPFSDTWMYESFIKLNKECVHCKIVDEIIHYILNEETMSVAMF